MAATARAYANPVTVVGACAALALSVALDVTGKASGVESLIVGLTAITATLVLDATARAERRFRLRGLLEAADWLPGPVLALSTATRVIVDERAEPEIVAEARRKLLRMTEDFEELAKGRVPRPGTDFELLLAGTDACHRRLEAVTNIPDGPPGLRWWGGDSGRRYWRANLNALARGVEITRVFVCQRLDPDLAELISEQSEAGVRTLVALRDGLDPAMHQNLVLWDSRRAWEARTNAPTELAENVFTVNERDLQRLTSAFITCFKAGRDIGGSG